jgi:hypothetical protein
VSLRTKLIVVFLAATLAPMAVLLWVTLHLFETSLRQATTVELDEMSTSLRATGREMYQTAREVLKADAAAGRVAARPVTVAEGAAFAASGAEEWFETAGEGGAVLRYWVRGKDGEIRLFERKLGVGMQQLTEQYTRARGLVERAGQYDLRRGLTLTLLTTAGVVYLVAPADAGVEARVADVGVGRFDGSTGGGRAGRGGAGDCGV